MSNQNKPIKRELTPEQRRLRGKRMLALLMTELAEKRGLKHPFPLKTKGENK